MSFQAICTHHFMKQLNQEQIMLSTSECYMKTFLKTLEMRTDFHQDANKNSKINW